MARVELIELRKAWARWSRSMTSTSIENGEFVAVLGPSGCGKSTTLFLLAGIYAPSAGEVRFDGRVVNEADAKDRNVCIVFQSYALYPHMTVRRNIMFPLRFKRVPRRASGARGMSQGIALRHGGRTVRLKMLGGTQWRAVTRLGRAVPGLRLAFDPLDVHEAAPPDFGGRDSGARRLCPRARKRGGHLLLPHPDRAARPRGRGRSDRHGEGGGRRGRRLAARARG